MDPVVDYPSMVFNLKMGFEYRYPEGKNGCSRMIGIVFASPLSPTAKTDLLPRIVDWHIRSGNNIDFFFAGYIPKFKATDNDEKYIEVEIPGMDWCYSPRMFNEFRRTLEEKTTWKAGGGCELILTDAHYDQDLHEAVIDYSCAAVCDLSAMKEAKAFDSVEKYFEKIFRAAEQSGRTAAFIRSQARGTTELSIAKMLLSLLPLKVGDDVSKISLHAIKDISKHDDELDESFALL